MYCGYFERILWFSENVNDLFLFLNWKQTTFQFSPLASPSGIIVGKDNQISNAYFWLLALASVSNMITTSSLATVKSKKQL